MYSPCLTAHVSIIYPHLINALTPALPISQNKSELCVPLAHDHTNQAGSRYKKKPKEEFPRGRPPVEGRVIWPGPVCLMLIDGPPPKAFISTGSVGESP